MSITRAKTSSVSQNAPKKRSALAGNDAILSGSFESIATVTVGAGNAASVTFNSIPSVYKHLQIRAIARDLRASTWIDTLWMYFNSDTTGANYNSHIMLGNGSGTNVTYDTGVNNYGMPIGLTTSTTYTLPYSPNIIDILDYGSTTKYKTARNLHGVEDNTNGQIRLRSGLWMSTAAISSITLQGDSGNLAQYSSFALYGIR